MNALGYRSWRGHARTLHWRGDSLIDRHGRDRRPLLGAFVSAGLIVALFTDGAVIRVRRHACPVDAAWARALRLLDR